MMGPIEAVSSVMFRPFKFSGRATRAEFWWFFLAEMIIVGVLLFLDFKMIMSNPEIFANPADLDPFSFTTIWWSIIAFFPRLAVSIRRLHDIGLSGFFYLLGLIPFIGPIILLIMFVMPSEQGRNSHGDPRNGGSSRARGSAGSGANSGQSGTLEGYAALIASERKTTPEHREAMDARRKAEVRSLYEQRVLGRTPQPQ